MTALDLHRILVAEARARYRNFWIGDMVRDVMCSQAYLEWLAPLLALTNILPGDERRFFVAYTTPHAFIAGRSLIEAFTSYCNAPASGQEH